VRRYLPIFPVLLLLAVQAQAQVGTFQFGGRGSAWSSSDSNTVFIDFARFPGSIAPVYFDGESNILDQLPLWSPFKFPTELDYEDGLIPRVWRAANGFYWYTAGTLTTEWVDGDSSSYSPPVRRGIESEWYTFDVGVPVPADVVGFYTPPTGFRADGTPLSDDIFKAFEVSISEEFDPVLNLENGDGDYHRLNHLVADFPLNYEANVQLDFPKQYVRFIRLQRKPSIDDGVRGVMQGTIGEFELKGAGVPRRVIYVSQIMDLGRIVNFGNIHWSVTPMRYVNGVAEEVENANASMRVEVRSGRDSDPNVYHEFTDTGAERVVTRERYENELKQPDQATGGGIQEGKPGLRASVVYDSENWTFWSFPITQPGVQAPLERGSHIQARITLESESYFDFVRLDSLWLETSAPLARQVVGEIARSDEPDPERGLTEVSLGEMTDFTYDIRAQFDNVGQGGFDALRIRTGSRPSFKQLEMGDPLVAVDPSEVREEDGELVIYLPRRVTRQSSDPLRVVFGAEVFVFANTFAGEVFDTQSTSLPQQIEAGDASDAIGTNNLRVLGGSEQTGDIIEDLRFVSSAVTPNGDGINDALRIEYTLFRMPAPIPVELNVYDLQGRRVGQVELGLQSAGPQQVEWDGSNGSGALLPPGMYLIEIALRAELKTFRHLQPVGVAY
jgi:hypothetical protein